MIYKNLVVNCLMNKPSSYRGLTFQIKRKLNGLRNSEFRDEKLFTRLYSTSRYPKPNELSYLSVPAEVPLLHLTMGQLIDQVAERFGDNEAVVISTPVETRHTYGKFKTDAENLAAGLLSLGLKKGDRVGIWGPNSYEWYLTHNAAMKAGLIVVNINPAYQTNEILYCLNKVGVKCLLIADSFKTSNYYEMIKKIVPDIGNCHPGKINSSAVPELKMLISFAETPSKGCFAFQEIMDRGKSNESKSLLSKVEKTVQFDDVCNIQFTSGTTGHPKGVMLSHHNIINNGYLIGRRFNYTDKDKVCVPVPLFHCFGSVVGIIVAMHFGATCVFPSAGFSPKDALQSISNERCTVLLGVPTMHSEILYHSEFKNCDVSSLRLAVIGGSVCHEDLIQLMKSKYSVDKIGNLYGMTETSPITFQSLVDDNDQLASQTVGYPVEHTEAKIVDTDGRIVLLGEQGEVCIRGYMVMLGYWEDQEKTAETIDQARWLRTGDLGMMEESGHLRIVGRLKDMIIRGGENIYPREIENFFLSHPKVEQAHVCGVPDFRMGEEVAIWISLKEGQSATEEEFRTFSKGNIAHYKIPRYFVFTNEFPKTTSGKIQKFIMGEETIKMFGIDEKHDRLKDITKG